MLVAIKSLKQSFVPSPQLAELMVAFRFMVNECVRIGLQNDVSSMKSLSKMTYEKLAKYDVMSYYKLCAISHSAGILTNRRKSIKRGLQPRKPYAKRPSLVSCYGFKIVDGNLKIPISRGQYFDIPLNAFVLNRLAEKNLQIRSFTISANNTLSICYSKEVEQIGNSGSIGIDRNLRNLTVGNAIEVVQYDLSKTIEIAENTVSILKSVKRNDVRIRRRLYQKYGGRRTRRISQQLHRLTKAIVQRAKQGGSAIVFEDIRHIRALYLRGSSQGTRLRGMMNNAWSFAEAKRQIEYKAKWEGVPVIQLTKGETRGTSQLCPQCGKKITQVDRKFRQLWCAECKGWMDRDVVAAMNISIKGLARFASSQGLAGEAMKGNPATPVILRVDASKLAFRQVPKS